MSEAERSGRTIEMNLELSAELERMDEAVKAGRQAWIEDEPPEALSGYAGLHVSGHDPNVTLHQYAGSNWGERILWCSGEETPPSLEGKTFVKPAPSAPLLLMDAARTRELFHDAKTPRIYDDIPTYVTGLIINETIALEEVATHEETEALISLVKELNAEDDSWQARVELAGLITSAFEDEQTHPLMRYSRYSGSETTTATITDKDFYAKILRVNSDSFAIDLKGAIVPQQLADRSVHLAQFLGQWHCWDGALTDSGSEDEAMANLDEAEIAALIELLEPYLSGADWQVVEGQERTTPPTNQMLAKCRERFEEVLQGSSMAHLTRYLTGINTYANVRKPAGSILADTNVHVFKVMEDCYDAFVWGRGAPEDLRGMALRFRYRTGEFYVSYPASRLLLRPLMTFQNLRQDHRLPQRDMSYQHVDDLLGLLDAS